MSWLSASKHHDPTGLPPVITSRTRQHRNVGLQQLLKYLTILSVAGILSTILPTPWSMPRYSTSNMKATPAAQIKVADPAHEWKDDVWPLREQTEWDISTDFPFPRKLEFDVQEGTWLRLDVHPKSGDVVFDMLGDLYCLPGKDALSNTGQIRARPVLLGIPHDSDPHFSPQGDRLVFKSDALLGIENIWVIAWKGCDNMDVRPAHVQSDDLRLALQAQDYDEDFLARGGKETEHMRVHRLVREGRFGAQRVTNETYRWVSDARFHPSGSKVIATKWYTSSRSLGAGEGWEYSVPSLAEISTNPNKVAVGSGNLVVGRSLPLGWTVDDYERQQIGPEQLIWQSSDGIIFSKNVLDQNTFQYSKDVHQGIYAIFQKNLTTGNVETLVDNSPGGASRPELSRDGRSLAFVRRVRDREALVIKDMVTGTLHHVWDGLSYDVSAISAPMGTYPSFAFTPSDDAIIIWAAGQIYSVPLKVNHFGERIASESSPFPIAFTAHIEKRLARTLHGDTDIVGQETQDYQRVHSFRQLRVDEKGENVVFQAAGVNYVQKLGAKKLLKVPVLVQDAPYYSPSFVYGSKDLIIHARWSDTQFTSFEVANLTSGMAYEITNLPMGRYQSPILCECTAQNRQIAFIKTAGDTLTGEVVATARPGLYLGDVTLPPQDSVIAEKVAVRNLRFVPSEIDTYDVIKIQFLDNNKQLLVHQSSRAFIIDLAADANEFGDYPHYTVAAGKMSSELVVSPSITKHKDQFVTESIAFVDFFHVYLAPGHQIKLDEEVWSKPGNATKGLVRLSLDGGHDISWSRDGKFIFWFLGPYLHSLEVSSLKNCATEIRHDQLNFGISCVKKLLEYQEIVVEHSTDIARLKRDALAAKHNHKDWLLSDENTDVVVISNATILTMASNDLETSLIRDHGVLVVRGGVIESVGNSGDFVTPSGATSIDAQGGFVIPGFIDVHAHWDGFSDFYPAKSWEMETFLAYGVTTIHNPSSSNVDGPYERDRIESGMGVGPRIFTVGDIIYGAGSPGIHQDIVNYQEAYSALVRIKVEGGPSSVSYKNYNLPSRASRQRLLLAARNLSMICVPEGGMNYDWDLTYIIDGMTTLEHALPIPKLYDDAMTLFALSGSGYTPTHIVNYGGVMGEQLVWATEDVPNDPKLRRFHRHDLLELFSESTARPKSSYALFNTSESAAKMVEKGLLVNIGAHGEKPLGVIYHAEMAFTKAGGLSNYEVLRAATSSAATTLGMSSSIGSLSPGKLADLLIYPPGVDLLKGDISETRDLMMVMRGGRMWHASTLMEVWPRYGTTRELPPFNAE